MPKTERILGYLPPTFRAGADRSALRALVGAFGGELQAAENSLAAVMRSHWVDFADRGADITTDLALIGSLYGLLPHQDETVEEFREHLKRYVRTFLEGPMTVQGLLRITAEVLHLHIDDEYECIDAWWDRSDETEISHRLSGADSATLVFGTGRATRKGSDAGPATVTGLVDLGIAVDLRTDPILWLELEGGESVPVDLAAAAADPSAVSPSELVAALNAAIGSVVAAIADGRLRLTSTSVGPTSRIDVVDGGQDAAPKVLGLAPRGYRGADDTSATVSGGVELNGPVDLADRRYLRITIDGDRPAEIDTASEAADPSAVSLDQIADAIDAAVGVAVATHDGRRLTLTSPTQGAGSSIGFSAPAAQDATARLFGAVNSTTFGADARAALAIGTEDIGGGVNLAEDSRIRLAMDGSAAVTVDVAGVDPAATLPGEIVAALNDGVGTAVAEHDGQHLTLRSPTVGTAGSITLEEVDRDATAAVLGFPSRSFHGTPMSTARFVGEQDLTAGVNLSARQYLVLSVDGDAVVEVDLHKHASDLEAVTLDELAAGINHVLGADVATDDGAHLILVSPSPGAVGSIEIIPLTTTTERRFLSHSLVTDDAGTRIFGFTARRAVGTEATSAVLDGQNDLLGGADLQERRFLRIRHDGADPVEVDCAGPRPRATTPAEIVTAINTAVNVRLASTDGHMITLVSPTTGDESSIVLELTRRRDALEPLGLTVGLRRGADPTGVNFAAIPDLSDGIDLPTGAAIAIGVDGGPVQDITVGDVGPSTRNLSQLVGSINSVLAAPVAAHDGSRLHLASPGTGSGAGLEIGTPTTGSDVTAELLGIGPRLYAGLPPEGAEVNGTIDLASAGPLGLRTFLSIAVNGGQPVTVDVAADAADIAAPTPAEIAAAIESACDVTATIIGGRLRLTSPTTGSASRIEIDHAPVGDARATIFGSVSFESVGKPARPAVLTGEADLFGPVDLRDASVLRIAMDNEPPMDVDVVGGSPEATILAEIVAAIDETRPDVAGATPDDRIRLTSTTTGSDSSVELVALRRLEIQEYPPVRKEVAIDEVAHGTRFTVDNHSAGPAALTIELETEHGTVGPKIASTDRHWSIRIDKTVGPGRRLTIGLDGETVVAKIFDPPVEPGEPEPPGHPVEPDSILIEGPAADVLRLERGRNRFVFLECDGARFGIDRFSVESDRETVFAGGECVESGIFNASHFSRQPVVRTSFAGAASAASKNRLKASWDVHRAGALIVNLPAQLDERYGVRFNEGRFGSAEPKSFPAVVTQPLNDPRQLLTVVNAGSALVEARLAAQAPIGWTEVAMPFRDPQPLTLGTSTQEARLYLGEEGLGGEVIELRARHVGRWANSVTVTARRSGPAIYDLEVHYPGGRFENARVTVAGPGRFGPSTKAGPFGVVMAKAAGVEVVVTRDGVRSENQESETENRESENENQESENRESDEPRKG